jgi:CSLREA domain-containing protein
MHVAGKMIRTILFLALITAAGGSPAPARAASPITVTTTPDVIANDGLCSLREAVIAVNTNSVYSNCPSGSAGEDSTLIDLAIPLPATFILSLAVKNEEHAASGDLDVRDSLTLERSTLAFNQAVAGGCIDHNGSTLSLTNVTLSQNSASDNGDGLQNRSSTTLLNVTVHGNSTSGSETGGNLFNDGDTASLAVRNTIVTGAGAGGKGIIGQ